VKGKSLDSILIFFNLKNHKENITFSDIGNATNTFPNEKQRLIYVAMSRPKHLLAMAFPNSISDSDLKNKFGDNINIIADLELNNQN
jgi:DNA helicase II / ATP-dependent DNA helicase PcrA